MKVNGPNNKSLVRFCFYPYYIMYTCHESAQELLKQNNTRISIICLEASQFGQLQEKNLFAQ